MALFLIALGLLFTGTDIYVGTGLVYPSYVAPQGEFHGVKIQEGIQGYVTQNVLGGNLRLDLLPDVIGCLLILLGAAMLIRHNRQYIGCIVLSVIAGAMSVGLRILPYFFNGAMLIITGLIFYFAAFVFEIWMEYKTVYTTVGISDSVMNYGTNRRLQFFWWLSVFSRAFMFFLMLTGLFGVGYWYTAAATAFTLVYTFLLFGTRTYVGTYKVYREGFDSAVLPEYIQEKMEGVSFHENRDIALSDLRYTRVLYYDFHKQIKEGELIVHHRIAYRTMRAFYQLYKMEYPIEKIRLVDEYEADDEKSMADNNTSAFNYRTVLGTGELSSHALGLAIDINPRINPYVTKDGFFPENASEYLERDPKKCMGEHRDKMIQKNDMAYRIMKRNGFLWGGEWSHAKDYQHFYVKEKNRTGGCL